MGCLLADPTAVDGHCRYSRPDVLSAARPFLLVCRSDPSTQAPLWPPPHPRAYARTVIKLTERLSSETARFFAASQTHLSAFIFLPVYSRCRQSRVGRVALKTPVRYNPAACALPSPSREEIYLGSCGIIPRDCCCTVGAPFQYSKYVGGSVMSRD